MHAAASSSSCNIDKGSRTVQIPDLPLRIVGIANSEIATKTSIVVGKTVILAVNHAEVAGTVDLVGLEDDLNIGHVEFGEVQDVCCQVRSMTKS